MNIYQITQIIYLGSGRRHEEVWYIQANRSPTSNEVRNKLDISIEDTILVRLADIDTWELS